MVTCLYIKSVVVSDVNCYFVPFTYFYLSQLHNGCSVYLLYFILYVCITYDFSQIPSHQTVHNLRGRRRQYRTYDVRRNNTNNNNNRYNVSRTTSSYIYLRSRVCLTTTLQVLRSGVRATCSRVQDAYKLDVSGVRLFICIVFIPSPPPPDLNR